ncbi:MAG: 2,3-bisphosphoglycerate-independent phosphoglycerate mutase [Firmicutes bacterium]|nr:2,3-bisphosphoglycerate-independent phosphoglycerate mutase [Bacillota bacterium]
MTGTELLRQLAVPNDTKLVLLVMDGLGGLPDPDTGKTELETAHTPNLDTLARHGSVGMTVPIIPGVSPGSAPAHLALFGYDPVQYQIGRGVLSALGVGMDLGPEDVACRVNFATQRDGVITDRRAGRIPTEEAERLCRKLAEIQVPGVTVDIRPEMQYRAVIVWRGPGLSDRVTGTDPQIEGRPPLAVRALEPEAEATAAAVNRFVEEANRVLADEPRANTILLRGFGRLPGIPTVGELFGLRAAVLAIYPMYRGLAKLVGMTELNAGDSFADQVEALRRAWDDYDYFFIHVKGGDSAGEDGDFARKVRVIEEVDALLPGILELKPDVLAVTGDHSTPAVMRRHSWHPVPLLLSSRWARPNPWVSGFGESECARGALGHIRSQELMGLMLAHGLRLQKFGA